jgi:putative hydrolase of the HAD superfamily
LEVLTNRGATIVVVSESNRQDCFSWLKSFGLLPFVSSVWTGEKSRGFYEQIIRKMQSAKRIVVVGDQLERDIRPAKEAGLITVYKPSAFSPVWKNAAHEAYADYTISSFADLVRVVDDEVSLVQ